MWDLIVSVPDHCLSFYFTGNTEDESFNIHAVYDKFEIDIRNVFDKHVPIKERCVKNNQLPYMNRNLRKAIYNKKMFYHKYLKVKNSRTWGKKQIK